MIDKIAEVKKPEKLIISYSTRLVEGFEFDESLLKAPSNYKDPEKIAAWIAKERDGLADELLMQPYSATFDRVVISDVTEQKSGHWAYPAANSGKPGIAVSIRNWLLKRFPKAWPNTPNPLCDGGPQVLFIGFDIRLFLKILGLECSLPANQPRLSDGKPDPTQCYNMPLAAWYGTSDYRDIGEAVKPKEFKYLTWQHVLKARGLTTKLKGWNGPHVDPDLDAVLAKELAMQLDLLNDTGDRK